MIVVSLLNGNVLVALSDGSHVHHTRAASWFASLHAPFATCPITQGTLLRMLLHFSTVPDMGSATAFLAQLTTHPVHRSWPDDLASGEIAWQGVQGHRQVTDAYLAALARHRGGKLASFDRVLALLQADGDVAVFKRLSYTSSTTKADPTILHSGIDAMPDLGLANRSPLDDPDNQRTTWVNFTSVASCFAT